MTDELIMAKVNGFIQELKEMGIEDLIFAAGSSSGMLAMQYDGDPKGVCYLAMATWMNAMFDSMDNTGVEFTNYGRRENNSD